MPERVPSNHESLQSLGGWGGTSTRGKQSGNVPTLCRFVTSVTSPLTVFSSRRTPLDMALILADAQVPGVTVSGGR
jgi:hypothetical protein